MAEVQDIDFDALYRGEPITEGAEGVPWDIGEPQPRVRELVASGQVSGDVLDVGCGLGDNAFFLASQGFRVTGVDAAPTAIERDRAKAAERGLDVEFVVADVTRLDGMEGRFDTVLDSALYHCLDADQQRVYAAALHRACRPGAKLHLFSFPDTMVIPVPNPVSERNLRETFADGWRILDLHRTAYTTALTPEQLARLVGSFTGETVPTGTQEADVDERGRVLMPVWHLTAERV